MDINREGTSTNKPPLLDGTNYAYWKVRMIAFLRAIIRMIAFLRAIDDQI